MMDAREQDGRSVVLDVFKGMAIFAIVVLHIAVVSRSDVGSEPAIPLQILYLGLIGFFIISGYLFKPGRGFGENMKRRISILFTALLTCAVILPLLTYAWCLLCGQPVGLDDLILGFQRSFGVERSFKPLETTVPWPICGISMGYYFLWCILGAFIIFYAVADRIRDDWKSGAAVIAVLMVFTIAYRELCDFGLPFYLNLSPIAAVFMIAGMYLAKGGLAERMESLRLGNTKMLGLILGCLAAVIILAVMFPPNIKFDWMCFGSHGGWSAIPFVLEGVTAFVVLLFLALILSKIPLVSTAFDRLGAHTMGILLLHNFVAKSALIPFFTFSAEAALPPDFGGIARFVFSLAVLAAAYEICAYGPSVLKRLKKRNDTAEH